MAFPLLILAVTGSPAQAGFLGAMRGLAYVLFGLPAGAYVDRWDRKKVMILSDTGRALALGSIPVALALGQLTLAQLYVVTFVEGMLFIFFGLAETSCLSRIVRKEQLPAAVSLNEGTYSLSGLLGPSVGGALYGIGRALPFAADAVSYAVSAISVVFIKMEFQEERTEPQRHIAEEIKEGLLWLWRQPVIRFLCTVNGGVNLLYGGWTLLLISLAQRHGASSFAIGLIFATGGVGTLLGTRAGRAGAEAIHRRHDHGLDRLALRHHLGAVCLGAEHRLARCRQCGRLPLRADLRDDALQLSPRTDPRCLAGAGE